MGDWMCVICEEDMREFKDQTVMFDGIPVTCSGWVCKYCGRVRLSPEETERIMNLLKGKVDGDAD